MKIKKKHVVFTAIAVFSLIGVTAIAIFSLGNNNHKAEASSNTISKDNSNPDTASGDNQLLQDNSTEDNNTEDNTKDDIQEESLKSNKNVSNNKTDRTIKSSNNTNVDKKRDDFESKYNEILQKKNRFKETGVDYPEEEVEKTYNPDGSMWCSTDDCKKAWLDETISTLKIEVLEKFLEEIVSLSKEYPEQKDTLQDIADDVRLLLKNYSDEADTARQAKEAEIAEAIRKRNSTGVISSTNTYPKQGNCPKDNLRYSIYGGYVCQATSYAGWKVYEKYHIEIKDWGNSNTWDDSARAVGFRVDNIPEAGSVAVSNSGYYGHVMWVEGVNPNGTINVSEYNNSSSSASRLDGDFGYRIGVSSTGLQFIHFIK